MIYRSQVRTSTSLKDHGRAVEGATDDPAIQRGLSPTVCCVCGGSGCRSSCADELHDNGECLEVSQKTNSLLCQQWRWVVAIIRACRLKQ